MYQFKPLGKSTSGSQTSDELQYTVNELFTLVAHAHFCHHQTTSYAKHQAMGYLYDAIDGLKDEIIEKMMGCMGTRYSSLTVEPVSNYTDDMCSMLAMKTKSCSQKLKAWAEQNSYLDIAQLADSLWGIGAKTQYLLTLS